MQSTLRPEVLDRIIFAKSLQRYGQVACEEKNDRFSLARGLLLLHDAAEAALGAIADHLNANVKGNKFLLDHYEIIKNSDPEKRTVPYHTQLRNLNTIRINIKHHGIFPDPHATTHFPVTVTALLEELCATFLGIDFSSVNLKSLIRNDKVRARIDTAEQEIEAGKYEEAMVSLAYAAYYIAESSTVPWFENMFSGREPKEPFLFTNPFKSDYTLTLLQHGVDPYTYRRFRNLTPRIGVDRQTDKVVYHWDKVYGHPGNWTQKNAKFCLEFCIDCALRFEKKLPYEYEIQRYTALYEDLLEPVGDEAIIWDLPLKWRPGPFTDQSVKRQPVLVLKKGQQIVGWATDYVDDLNEWSVMSNDIPTETQDTSGHGFVAKSDVNVTRRERQHKGAAEPSDTNNQT